METKNKVILTFIVLIFLIAALYIFADWFSKTTGFLVEDDPDNKLAKCLTQKGARLYSASSCPNCKKQESFLGIAIFESLNKIDCSSSPLSCSELRMVPAWFVNNSMHYGVKTTQELKALSGCE